MISFGNIDISAMYVGETEVSSAYIGENLIYENTPPEPPTECITFTALEDSEIGLARFSPNQHLEVNTTGRPNGWKEIIEPVVEVPQWRVRVKAGKSIYMRGTLSSNNSGAMFTRFWMDGNFKVSGEIKYFWCYGESGPLALRDYCGFRMFDSCASLTDISELVFPDITAKGCYQEMFNGCGITTAPELPATTLSQHCYRRMFKNCTALTTAPDLPATTLPVGCYYELFYNDSLITSIKMYGRYLDNDCMTNWVYNLGSSGTLYKNPAMTWIYGSSACPSGWDQVDWVQ